MICTRMDAQTLYHALEQEFRPWECTEVFPKIGLQFHHTDWVRCVYTATFAGREVFQRLMDEDARECMLFTHHPVPQRDYPSQKPPSLPQLYLDFMKENRITLFSYHIPLDRNGLYSPGNSLAKVLGAVPVEEFYQQNQVSMGIICRSLYTSLSQLCSNVEKTVGHPIACYSYGEEKLKDGRFAIMAGGAKNHKIYQELAEKGVYAFLTGVTTPTVEWCAENHRKAKEYRVSVIGGTHYSTEKFALIAIRSFFQNLGLKTCFLEESPHFEEL